MTDRSELPIQAEPLSIEQFRDSYMLSDRILRARDTPDLMSFGPSICTLETALDEGFLETAVDFRPELVATYVTGIQLDFNGEIYTDASFFFRQGGNTSADPDWLGRVGFSSGSKSLNYTFHRDGTIDVCAQDSAIRSFQMDEVRAAEANELVGNLAKIKGYLTYRKTGELALKS